VAPAEKVVSEKIAMLWTTRCTGLRRISPWTIRVLATSSHAVHTGPSTTRLARSRTAVAVA